MENMPSYHATESLAMALVVPMVVVLSTTKMRMEVVQNMAPGTMIEFRKFSGELLDMYANNIKFAEGEVVVTNKHFGIQLKRFVSE